MTSLIFSPSSDRDGFTEAITSSTRNTPEPVIRELLQNCLDAVLYEAETLQDENHLAEIVFTIREVPLESIPGQEKYREAFQRACQARSKGTQGKDELRIIDHINRTLNNTHTKVLFCRDNGIGLSAERMTKLLWPGNTTKSEGQAGAFGLGHRYAFQASDIRYVLYAGRSGVENSVKEIASGHAILAAHPSPDNKTRSAHGLFLDDLDDDWDSLPVFGKSTPAILKPEMDAIYETEFKTGSAVAILGFNDFNEEDPSTVAHEILSAAARSFFAAIKSNKMSVKIIDEINGTTDILDNNTIEEKLKILRTEKRAKIEGFLAGIRASEAYRTLTHAESSDNVLSVAGADIFVRSLDKQDSDTIRKKYEVNLCRNGMWISNNVPECSTSDFGSCFPFNAVIRLDDGKQRLHELIRSAEGPEHREIDLKRLEPHERKELRELMKKIANAIREHVGEDDEATRYVPEGFATIDSFEAKKAAPKKPIRPPGTSRKGQSTKGKRQGKGRGGKTAKKPSPGSSITVRTSQRLVTEANDTAQKLQNAKLQVLLKADLDSDHKPSKYWGVQVYSESGSDESCEQPVPFEYLVLKEIVVPGDPVVTAAGSQENPCRELVIPSHGDEPLNMTITFEAGQQLSETDVLRVNLVRRSKLPDNQSQRTILQAAN